MNYYELFQATLENQYKRMVSSHHAIDLAKRLTRGLLTGTADIHGIGAIKATCKLLKIKHSIIGIQTFLNKGE